MINKSDIISYDVYELDIYKLKNTVIDLEINDVVVYGIGNNGFLVYQLFKNLGINIKYYVDVKALDKVDSFRGKQVLTPEEFKNKYDFGFPVIGDLTLYAKWRKASDPVDPDEEEQPLETVYTPGDVDRDGHTNARDVTNIMKHIVGNEPEHRHLALVVEVLALVEVGAGIEHHEAEAPRLCAFVQRVDKAESVLLVYGRKTNAYELLFECFTHYRHLRRR